MEIHDIWIRQKGIGFQICRFYDANDIKQPLSALALMMINRGRIFEGSMLVQRGSETGAVVDWLFLESNSLSNYVFFGSICGNTVGQESLRSTLEFDQSRLKCAALSLITLLSDERALPFLSSNQVLNSKLHVFDLFLHMISDYIGDFRAFKLINLIKRFYYSTSVIIEHLNEIKRLRELVGSNEILSL